jgi:hypothetical protein
VTGAFTRTVGSWDPYQFEIADKTGLYVGQRISSPALGETAFITAIDTGTTSDTTGEYVEFPNPTNVYVVTFTGPRAYDGPLLESMTFSGGGFYFTSFSVTDISTDCYGKPFTIRAYKNGVNTPLPLYQTNGTSNYSEINVIDNSGSFSFVGGGLLSDDIQDITGGFKVDLVTVGPPPSVPLSLASDVDRIIIESGASGGNTYSASLMSGKPSWIVEDAGANNNGDLTYGFDGSGMHFNGNANSGGPAFPYRTSFTIPANQRVVVQVDIVHAYSCSDQAVVIFPEGANPTFNWPGQESNPQDALTAALNCYVPQLWSTQTDTYDRANAVLMFSGIYKLIITYDPNASSGSFKMEVKNSGGSVLSTQVINDKLESGNAYRIGFSADSDFSAFDDSSEPSPAYFKNLSITYGN